MPSKIADIGPEPEQCEGKRQTRAVEGLAQAKLRTPPGTAPGNPNYMLLPNQPALKFSQRHEPCSAYSSLSHSSSVRRRARRMQGTSALMAVQLPLATTPTCRQTSFSDSKTASRGFGASSVQLCDLVSELLQVSMLLHGRIVVPQALALLLVRLLEGEEDVVLLEVPVRTMLEPERLGLGLVRHELGFDHKRGLDAKHGIAGGAERGGVWRGREERISSDKASASWKTHDSRNWSPLK